MNTTDDGYDPDVDENHSRVGVPVGVVLALICAGGIVDLLFDRPTDWRSWHVGFEVTMVIASAVGACALFRDLRLAQASVGALRVDLKRQAAERDAWRASAQDALGELGKAIDQRFRAWDLTPAEREVALWILKGESHKRIATLTGRSERTVRQHAVAVYSKSGLRGRAELAAFFLQDLLIPGDERAR